MNPHTSQSDSGARVELRDLSWRPYGSARPILEHVNLTIAAGERVLLAGPSGSGKSTLLRAIGGLLLTADAGELSGQVRVAGRDPRDVPGAIGLVLQDPGAGTVASTIERDVAFGLENTRVPTTSMPPTIERALRAVGLDDLPGDRSPDQVSGGQSQRLALAGALAMGPQVLLLDEPTAMLDAATAADVRAVVDEVVRDRGLTMVVVEHRLDGWLDLVDRLVVLDRSAAVVADGPPVQVLAEHGDALLAQGIWVPGAPEPTPVEFELPRVSTARSPGEEVLATRHVDVVHVTRRLDGPTVRTTAVQDAGVTVFSGLAVAIVGPSGAGKTSLMHAVSGISPPTSGQVDLLGRADPATWPTREIAAALAWIPQRAASSLVGRTVLDEVLTTPRALGLDETVARTRARALLSAMGLWEASERDPRTLSGGEQRRLAVAAALAHGPSLVVADEPTIGQDRHTWAAVIGAIAAIRGEGAGVLATTHDPGVIARAATVLRLDPVTSAQTPVGQVRRSLFSMMNPLALLIAALVVMPLPALLDHWRQGLAVLGVEVLLCCLGMLTTGTGQRPVGRWRGVGIRLALGALGVFGVAWSSWLLGGRDLEVAANAGLRVLCLIVPSAFVLGFIDPERLGDYLAQRVHLPARPVVAATAALARVQAFARLWSELMTTRRVRGVKAERGLAARGREAVAVTVDLLVGALGQASALALAMDARGFAAARDRTWAAAAPWRGADTIGVLLATTVLVVAALTRP